MTPDDDPTRRLLAPRRRPTGAASAGTSAAISTTTPTTTRTTKPTTTPTTTQAAALGPPAQRTRRLLVPLLAVTLLPVLAAILWYFWFWRLGNAAPTPPAQAAQQAKVAPALLPPAPTASQPVPALPLTAFDELLRAAPAADWRWSRFKPNPAVLVIEFPTLHEQGMAMNRLAAMFEKRGGRRDRLLSDAELGDLLQRSGDTVATFYQGHDYPATNLVRFFALADAQPALLNAQERRLRGLLVDAGVLRAGTGTVPVVNQAVVSFTALQADDPATLADEEVDPARRDAVLRHELSHGEYFTNPAYRAHSTHFWARVLTAAERKTFRNYLGSLDYDPGDEDLMANETQAMLMHTPDTRAFSARSLGISQAALASMRTRFRVGDPQHGLKPQGMDIGHFFLALRPTLFQAPGAFEAQVATFTTSLRATKPIDPAVPVMVAGDRERRIAAERMRDGIPVGPGLLAEIRRIGDTSGVPWLLG